MLKARPEIDAMIERYIQLRDTAREWLYYRGPLPKRQATHAWHTWENAAKKQHAEIMEQVDAYHAYGNRCHSATIASAMHAAAVDILQTLAHLD